MRTEFSDFVRRYLDAWNRHDVTAIDMLYAADALQESPLGTLEGLDAIRGYWQTLLHTFPDLSMDCRLQFVTGFHGVMEWTIKGTHRGHLETPAGSLPATGKCIDYSGVLSWEMGDQGNIVYERLYCDFADLLARLGALKIAVPA